MATPYPASASKSSNRRILCPTRRASPPRAGSWTGQRPLFRATWCYVSSPAALSSLLVAPLEGLTLEDKQSVNRALLKSGASISEMNCVRRHLSAIKGGRLAAACHPAKVVTLLISDVPGDRPMDIGPARQCRPHHLCRRARDHQALRRDLSANVMEVLRSGRGESVKPGDPRLAGNERASSRRRRWRSRRPRSGGARCGRARVHPRRQHRRRGARRRRSDRRDRASGSRHGQPFEPPCILLSGGETTVTVRGQGRGGRNVEFLLSLAIALDGCPAIHAIAGDTDGVDGMRKSPAHTSPPIRSSARGRKA